MPNLRKLKRREYDELEQALLDVEEAEADFGRPAGNHYKLMQLLHRLFGLMHLDKIEMKRVAQEAINNGFEPD